MSKIQLIFNFARKIFSLARLSEKFFKKRPGILLRSFPPSDKSDEVAQRQEITLNPSLKKRDFPPSFSDRNESRWYIGKRRGSGMIFILIACSEIAWHMILCQNFYFLNFGSASNFTNSEQSELFFEIAKWAKRLFWLLFQLAGKSDSMESR